VPTNAAQAHNDRNVYILGGGFSRDAGLPLVAGFMDTMRDSVEWLVANKRPREASAVGEVLDFRLKAAAAAYRVRLDVESVEELFSLASAAAGTDLAENVRLAIAATLDFAKSCASPPHLEVRLAKGSDLPKAWKKTDYHATAAGPQGTLEIESYIAPAYEFMRV
jgi:hypothetical protein